MAGTNVIVNGTFDDGKKGWSGTDIEANHQEKSYLHNGSKNRVAEMDGHRGETTVMEQTFTVADPTSTELTLDAALRNEANANAGTDGFTVEIIDGSGTVLAGTTILPTENGFVSFSLPVTFPNAGQYTLRFTEVGVDDSLGAIVDNVSLIVCFGADTGIATPDGTRRAGALSIGDQVVTEHGSSPIRWIGRRYVSPAEMANKPKFKPVKITAGALGQNLPRRDIWLSRQHRMLCSGPVVNRMFGQQEVLLPAIRLATLPGIYVDTEIKAITYIHILLDRHELVFAEGAPSETLLLGDETIQSLSPLALKEVTELFPEIGKGSFVPESTRLIPARRQQKRLIERLAKNKKTPHQRQGAY